MLIALLATMAMLEGVLVIGGLRPRSSLPTMSISQRWLDRAVCAAHRGYGSSTRCEVEDVL